MAGARRPTILNYLRRMLGAAADGGVSDADLLRRFVKERDEAAFELLMWRHAAMVLHVCRQVLSDVEAAEDAFQATFLVFVRKAGSISRREALGSWLYRVAYRTALKARTQSKKRPCPIPELDCLAAPVDADDAGQREGLATKERKFAMPMAPVPRTGNERTKVCEKKWNRPASASGC